MVTIRIGDDEESLTWEQWEQRVQAGRIPGYALVRFEPVTGHDFVQAQELDAFQSLLDDARKDWSDRYRSGAPPWMSALIAGVQIRLWWLLWTGGLLGVVDALHLWQPAVLEEGEVWRLLSMGVLHMDPGHILANLVMFVYVGWYLERALGRLNLLVIYTASVLGGSLLSILFTPAVPSLGASGGVLGVVAAATVFGFIRHSLLPERARMVFGVALLPYLLLVYGMGWMSETTDNWAHTGGLVTGAVVALLVDPPGLERRRYWNRIVWGGSAALLIGILASVYVLGPRLLTIEDVDARVAAPLARPQYREIEWTAPSNWERGSVAGSSGYVSRASGNRGWTVRQRTVGGPADAASELGEWLADVRSDWDGVQAGPVDPVTFGGAEALHQRVQVPGAPDVVMERWVRARGGMVLEATWTVEAALEGRMAPVRDSLVDGVVWNEPEALVRAREAVERRPGNRALRRQLADEQLRVGDVEQGLDTWRALTKERPESPDGWVGLVRALRDHGQDDAGVWASALAAGDHPSVVSEVAVAMAATRPDDARGLAELAWTAMPGDRYIRRARKALGMPVTLDETTPAHLLVDPLTGAPLSAPRRLAVEGPWTLDQARETGAALASERSALLDDLEATPDARAIGTLLMLRNQALPAPAELEDHAAGLVTELRSAAGSSPSDVVWLGPRGQAWLTARLQADPGFLDELEAAAAVEDDADEATLGAWRSSLGLGLTRSPRGPVLTRG